MLIALGVTGGIGAYKAVEVARGLQKRGHEVVAIMTAAATRFVGPVTFEAITRRRVITDQFEPGLPWFVSVARGQVRLYLSEHKGDARPNTLIHLYVNDIDAVSEEFGTAVDEDGLAGRECDLEDPDGNRLRVATRRS